MKRTFISIVIGVAIAGCASTEVVEGTQNAHDDAREQIAQAESLANDMTNAPILLPMQEYPYLPKKSLPRGSFKAELPPILRSLTAVHYSQPGLLTIQGFARLVAEEFKVSVKVDDTTAPSANSNNVVPEIKVDLSSLPAMPRAELVTTVTRLLGTDWDWQDGTLLIQPAFTRSYPVASSPASTESKVRSGKQSTTTAGVSGGTGGGTGGNFSNELTAGSDSKLDAWKDLESALTRIAGEKNVVPGKSFNMVTVTCPKACHKIVKQFIDNVNHSLNQQVLLMVKEVTVASTQTGESGIDWNLVYRNMLDGNKYRLLLSGPSSLVSDKAGLIQNIFVPTDVNNPSTIDGTSLLVRAMSGASKFVDVKPYSQLVVNNDTTTLTNTDQQSYTQSFTVVPSTVLGGAPQYVGNPGYATFGQILQVSPTILPDGNIRMSFSLDDTSGNVNKGTGQGVPDSVLSSTVGVNTRFIVKPGSTLVLSSFKRIKNRSNNQGLLAGQKLGSESGSQDVTETVILVTPYIANVGAL